MVTWSPIVSDAVGVGDVGSAYVLPLSSVTVLFLVSTLMTVPFTWSAKAATEVMARNAAALAATTSFFIDLLHTLNAAQAETSSTRRASVPQSTMLNRGLRPQPMPSITCD